MLLCMQTALETGSTFASYVVEAQRPGVCGFAVYAARHREFDQRVTLRIGTAPAETEVNRSAHLLDHPNVERVLDQGVAADGSVFTVTERVAGEPICEYCDARAMDVKGRVRLLLHAAEAVGYAHQHVQPHRQLSADMVLVDEAGQVKVCGFGMGSAEGSQPEALAHDLQCLGSIGSLLLAGSDVPGMCAWLAGQSGNVQRQIAQRRSTGVARLLRELRGDLDAVIAHMGARETVHYASVDLAAADLTRVLQGRSTGVYRATRWERLRLWATFQPTTAAAVAVLLVTAVGASAVFARQTVSLNGQRRESEARLGELVALTGVLETRLYAAAESMPAPVPVRVALVRQTRETLDAATAGATLSPEVAVGVAQQYRALAKRSEELGDAPGARAELSRAQSVERAAK